MLSSPVAVCFVMNNACSCRLLSGHHACCIGFFGEPHIPDPAQQFAGYLYDNQFRLFSFLQLPAVVERQCRIGSLCCPGTFYQITAQLAAGAHCAGTDRLNTTLHSGCACEHQDQHKLSGLVSAEEYILIFSSRKANFKYPNNTALFVTCYARATF